MSSGEPARARWVSELYGRHPGEEIYIVGTGTSLRVFPTEILEDKITIGLNLAWQVVNPTYGITIHPGICLPEFLDEPQSRPDITWIVKRDKVPEQHLPEADGRCYYFRVDGKPDSGTDVQSDQGRVLEWVAEPSEQFLYLYSSISQPAVNLAANMGAKTIVLVGCDNTALLGNHHATDQHTMWLGADPAQRYRRYFDGLAEMRPLLRARGVALVSLSPFLTLGPHDQDFRQLCEELDVPEFLENEDITHIHRPDALVSSARSRLPGRAATATPQSWRGRVRRTLSRFGPSG